MEYVNYSVYIGQHYGNDLPQNRQKEVNSGNPSTRGLSKRIIKKAGD
ncbi:hypothetical protein [Alkalimarinus alittae]|uniref:Uncharacterized protein n=1 Tax=Alkalimarinus alittae TaxID=2961619 RepID=A0ABY6N6N0_9ALTE|nr:hypothetical protein [Alkalimarinus alittae]UZE97680.1 hypothetical protein NKI27_08080 [Alkalimarinus alittae]